MVEAQASPNMQHMRSSRFLATIGMLQAASWKPVLAVSCMLLVQSCNREPLAPASAVQVAAPAAARQLLFGFYGIESTWRWTGPNFGVVLRPPLGNTVRPVRLKVELYLPPSQIEELGPVTLSAESPGFTIGSMTFEQGGAREYNTAVPLGALCTNLLPITFTFDKFAPASDRDGRDLGAVVSYVGLVSGD